MDRLRIADRLTGFAAGLFVLATFAVYAAAGVTIEVVPSVMLGSVTAIAAVLLIPAF